MCRVKTNQPVARYVNPMTDFGFKKVFGDPDVMKAFLTDLLKPESPIAQITFLNKEMIPENALERGVIYDMRCKTENGSEFIVEMPSKEREAYRQSLDAFRTNVATYAWERAQGHDEGHEEGLAEGLEKGRAEGVEQGRIEANNATARNLKSLGVPVETIAQATGLSIDEINNL